MQSAATQGESAAAAAAATTPLTCSTSTKVPYSGSLNNQADRKRRRLWTPEEDLALIAAVDKCGEGNWTTVLKNHYDFDRTASQLSQVSSRPLTSSLEPLSSSFMSSNTAAMGDLLKSHAIVKSKV